MANTQAMDISKQSLVPPIPDRHGLNRHSAPALPGLGDLFLEAAAQLGNNKSQPQAGPLSLASPGVGMQLHGFRHSFSAGTPFSHGGPFADSLSNEVERALYIRQQQQENIFKSMAFANQSKFAGKVSSTNTAFSRISQWILKFRQMNQVAQLHFLSRMFSHNIQRTQRLITLARVLDPTCGLSQNLVQKAYLISRRAHWQ